MGFQPVIGRKGRLGGEQPKAVTLNFNLGRIVILTWAYGIMKNRFGPEIHYVRLLRDEEQPDVFLIQPCHADAHGARRLDITHGTSPSVSARHLFTRLGLPREGFKRYPVTWNEEYGGLLVHWKEPIEMEETIEPLPALRRNKSREERKEGKGN